MPSPPIDLTRGHNSTGQDELPDHGAWTSHLYEGEAGAEMVVMPTDLLNTPPRKGGRPPDLTEDEQLQRDLENRERSIRRSKTNIRRYALTNELNYLLTLTIRDNLTDLKAAWTLWSRFVRVLKRNLGLVDWSYLVIAERQKRGAIHFHAAINGWHPAQEVREAWWHVLGGRGKGNIDLQAPKKRKGVLGVASYLAKYISKAVDEVEAGQRRFRRSEGLEMPKTVNEASFCPGRSMTDWLKLMFGCRGWKDFHVVRIERDKPADGEEGEGSIKQLIGFWVTSWPNGGQRIEVSSDGPRKTLAANACEA